MNERRRRRALITRPQEDSADIAIALARRGITPVLAPMMRIEYAASEIENEIDLAQAILFTSRNGVRAFSRLSPRRDMPAFAVGDSTAALARDNGFSRVESAQGDSNDLARLVAAQLKPEDGILFHAAGATVAGDLAETLNDSGFKTVRRALYEAKPVPALDDETIAALRDRTLDYVLFFSPRTGRIFADLVAAAGLGDTCDSLTAICLSDAVAGEISDLPWKEKNVAVTPTTEALIAVLSGSENGSALPPVPATSTRTSAPPDKPAETETDTEDLIERAVETTAAAGMEGEPPEAAQPNTRSQTTPPPAPQRPDPVAEQQTETPEEKPAAAAAPAPAEMPAETSEKESADRGAGGRKKSVATSLPMAAGIVAAALAAAYLTLPMWRDHLPPQARERLAGTETATKALQAENAELKTRIDDLDKILIAANKEIADTRKKAGAEIGDLKSRLADSEKSAQELKTNAEAAQKAAGDVATLKAKLASLEKELTATKAARTDAENQARQAREAQSAAVQAASSAAAEMSAKIATLEKQVTLARAAVLSADKADTVAVAAGKLRDALSRSDPFGAEIATLKRVSGANPAIAAALSGIESFANRGVPRRSTLFADLPATVAAVLDATRAPAKTGWIDRAAAKLTGFVKIRRIDGKGDGTDAVLARAEIAAKRGDLAGAAKQISTLTDSAATAAMPWLSSARARLAAEQASAALDRIVLTAVAKGAKPDGPAQ